MNGSVKHLNLYRRHPGSSRAPSSEPIPPETLGRTSVTYAIVKTLMCPTVGHVAHPPPPSSPVMRLCLSYLLPHHGLWFWLCGTSHTYLHRFVFACSARVDSAQPPHASSWAQTKPSTNATTSLTEGVKAFHLRAKRNRWTRREIKGKLH